MWILSSVAFAQMLEPAIPVNATASLMFGAGWEDKRPHLAVSFELGVMVTTPTFVAASGGLYSQISLVNTDGLELDFGVRGGARLNGWTACGGLYYVPVAQAMGQAAIALREEGPARRYGAFVSVLPLAFEYSSTYGQYYHKNYKVWSDKHIMAGFHGPPPCAEGRPLRTDHGLVVPEARLFGASRAGGERWLQRGQHEQAAVAAFARLVRELRAVRAPNSLVERARLAMEDEVRHTLLCYAEAARASGARVRWRPLPNPAQRPGNRGARLTRLALESLVDGAYTEGEAANRAFCARDGARGRVAEIEHVIATDEQRHATLGWDIARWCAREGGQEVLGALGWAKRGGGRGETPRR